MKPRKAALNATTKIVPLSMNEPPKVVSPSNPYRSRNPEEERDRVGSQALSKMLRHPREFIKAPGQWSNLPAVRPTKMLGLNIAKVRPLRAPTHSTPLKEKGPTGRNRGGAG